jgi:hypothetical protein
MNNYRLTSFITYKKEIGNYETLTLPRLSYEQKTEQINNKWQDRIVNTKYPHCAWWPMPVILATRQAGIRKIMFRASLGKKYVRSH